VSTVSARPIPLLDLQAQHGQIREEALAAVTRVIDSQKFILGEEVKKLEEEIASYSSTKFAIGCASGSDALLLALMALDCGPGHEVVTSPFTFFATGGAIARTGATPVFVDIDPNTFNLDPNRIEDALKKHANVRAIIPVHLFGQCADMDPLLALAQSHGIAVIEDAAQSIGAEYKGRRAGSLGDMGCLSFFPSKNLGAYGDGGMVTTNDERLARKLAALRVHGGIRKYYHEWVGINSRLDALQAAVLRVKFQYLDSWTEGRQRNADLYRKMLAELRVPVIAPQAAPFTSRHIYNQFTIRCGQRDALQAYLKQNGIGTEIYYPLPLHLQACFSNLGYRAGDLPLSEQVAAEALSVPIYPELPAEDIEQVCRTIQAFYSQR
jgi:dTDP-4-amino-4,6-dideoxygalactose transaminase